jgi:hypothetical protein
MRPNVTLNRKMLCLHVLEAALLLARKLFYLRVQIGSLRVHLREGGNEEGGER